MADTIQLRCPGCAETIHVDAGFIGGVCRCSECGTVIAVHGGDRDATQATGRADSPTRAGPELSSDFDHIQVVSIDPDAVPQQDTGLSSRPPIESRTHPSDRKANKSPLPMMLGIGGGLIAMIAVLVVVIIAVTSGSGPSTANTDQAGISPAETRDRLQSQTDEPREAKSTTKQADREPEPGVSVTDPRFGAPRLAGYTLRAGWEFDKDATDTVKGEKAMQARLLKGAKVKNGRLVLDGIDDRMNILVGPGLNNGGRRLRIDIRFRAQGLYRPGKAQILFETGGGQRGLNIYLYNGRLYCGGYNIPGAPQSGWAGNWLQTEDGVIVEGQWHTLSMVLDADGEPKPDALIAQLDGKRIGSTTGARIWRNAGLNGIGVNHQNTFLHTGESFAPCLFKGEIDYVRLYQKN